MFNTSVPLFKDELFKGKKNVPTTPNFPAVFKQELKNLADFRKNAPKEMQEKLKEFEQHAKHINNVFCGLIRGTTMLFCIVKMVEANDPILKSFPTAPVQAMRQYTEVKASSESNFENSKNEDGSGSSLGSDKADSELPHICIAMYRLVEYAVKNNLQRHILAYQPKIDRKERVYIICLRKFMKVCLQRLEEQKKQLFLGTDYFRALRRNDEEYQRRIDELEGIYKTLLQHHKRESDVQSQKVYEVQIQQLKIQQVHEAELENDRVKNQLIFSKITRNLGEERANRNQTLDSIILLYEKTLEKNLKRCKGLRETRYKREMAVLNMIEKFDRDYGGEYKKWEKQIEHYENMKAKSVKLEEDLQKNVFERWPILVMEEAHKKELTRLRQLRAVKIIQKWARNILGKRWDLFDGWDIPDTPRGKGKKKGKGNQPKARVAAAGKPSSTKISDNDDEAMGGGGSLQSGDAKTVTDENDEQEELKAKGKKGKKGKNK